MSGSIPSNAVKTGVAVVVERIPSSRRDNLSRSSWLPSCSSCGAFPTTERCVDPTVHEVILHLALSGWSRAVCLLHGLLPASHAGRAIDEKSCLQSWIHHRPAAL